MLLLIFLLIDELLFSTQKSPVGTPDERVESVKDTSFIDMTNSLEGLE